MPALPLTGRPTPASRFAAWALCLGAAGLPLLHLDGLLWQGHTVPKMIWLRAVALVLLALGGAALVRVRRPVGLSVPTVACVAFVAWAGLATALGGSLHVGFLGAVHRYEGWVGFAAYAVFFLTAGALGRRSSGLPPVVWRVGWAVSFAVGAVGVAQAFWPESSAAPVLGLRALERSSATFGNPLFLGMFAALAVPFGLATASAERRRWLRTLGAAAAAVLGAAAYLTHSRGAWLGLAVGLGVLLAVAPGRRRLAATALAAAVAAAALVAGTSFLAAERTVTEDLSPGVRLEQAFAGGGTVGTRVELYRGVARLIAERPVTGRGFETYAAAAARVRTLRLVLLESPHAYPDRPHSPQLYLAYAAGLPGLALYALLVGSALLAAAARLRGGAGGRSSTGGPAPGSSPAGTAAAGGLFAGCLGYLAAEATAFSVVEVTPLFWAALGWVSASAPARSSVPAAVARVVGAAVLVAAVPGAYAVLGHASEVARADRIHHGVVSRPLDPSRVTEIDRLEARATELDPYTPFYWNTRALILSRGWTAGGPPGLLERAEEVARDGLVRIPGDPSLTVTLSDILLKAGRPREAADVLEAHLRADPYLQDARFNLALAHLALDDPGRAAAELERAVEIVPSDAEAFWYLARARDDLGEAAAAAAARARALELDPSLGDPP